MLLMSVTDDVLNRGTDVRAEQFRNMLLMFVPRTATPLPSPVSVIGDPLYEPEI
jgi:hypothetical protein